MFVNSNPVSDHSKEGVIGSWYCGKGDKDGSGESTTLSGASPECWESCPEAG